jgi:RNA recognition motif-containing protein
MYQNTLHRNNYFYDNVNICQAQLSAECQRGGDRAITTEPVRTKLYVSNFPSNCTRRHLTEFFGKYGQVLECAIMWDKYAFIHYGSMQEAQNALQDSNQMYLIQFIPFFGYTYNYKQFKIRYVCNQVIFIASVISTIF